MRLAAARWLDERFEHALAAIPPEMAAKLLDEALTRLPELQQQARGFAAAVRTALHSP